MWWPTFMASAASVRMQQFAIGWLVVLIAAAEGAPERAALYLGLLGLARAIPAVSLALIAGVVVDRVDRRLLLILCQAAFGLAAIAVGAAVLAGAASLAVVLPAGAAYAATSVLYVPTRQAIQPRLVGERDLASAIGLNGIALNGSAFIGPLLGGMIIVPFGVGGVLLAAGIGHLLVGAGLTLLSPYPVRTHGPRTNLVRSVTDGLVYVRSNALLLWLLVAYGGTLILVDPYVELLPALAREVFRMGPVELSWLMAAAGVGSFGAGLAVATLRGLQRYPVVPFAAIASGGLLLAAFTRQRELVALLVLAAGLGFTGIFAGSSLSLIVQTTTPDRLRGRVNSLFNLLVDAGSPVGALTLGVLATAAGVDTALMGSGLLLAAVAAWIGARRSVARRVPSPASDGSLDRGPASVVIET